MNHYTNNKSYSMNRQLLCLSPRYLRQRILSVYCICPSYSYFTSLSMFMRTVVNGLSYNFISYTVFFSITAIFISSTSMSPVLALVNRVPTVT